VQFGFLKIDAWVGCQPSQQFIKASGQTQEGLSEHTPFGTGSHPIYDQNHDLELI
jgi:hypothetical protein